MSAEAIGWRDEYGVDHGRRRRNAMLVSLAIHGLMIALFAVSPPRPVAELPQVLAVELVAGPAARPAPRPAPAPKQAAPEPAPPPPPVTKAPVQVLPEESPGRIREAKPEPKQVAKVEPRPRRKREKELSYEDAMAALDDELGPDQTRELLTPAPPRDAPAEPEASGGQPESRPGAVVAPELAAWNAKTQRRIRNSWVTPPDLRGRGLVTQLELKLSAAGDVLGEPRVVRSSGNPFFDDNAVRAVMKAAPLPPPPEPGRRIFLFRSEAN